MTRCGKIVLLSDCNLIGDEPQASIHSGPWWTGRAGLWGLALLVGLVWAQAGCDQGAKTCPERWGEVSCGTCPVDAVSGASGASEVCVYCRTGTSCPQDPCTQACVGPACSDYEIPCGRVQDGGVVTEGLVPQGCLCPEGTTQSGWVEEGDGPFLVCTCR